MDVRNRLFEREYGYAPSHPPNACGCDFCDCGACDSEIPSTVVVPLPCGVVSGWRCDSIGETAVEVLPLATPVRAALTWIEVSHSQLASS